MRDRLSFRLVATIIGVVLAVVGWLSVPAYFAAMAPQHSSGDGALLELYTLFVREGVWELGPYSRYGWYHPGPLMFRLLLPLYEQSGLHPFALNGGALLMSLASMALCLSLALRLGRAASGAALGVGLLVLTLRGGDVAISFWNPHIIVFPMLAFLLSTAAVAYGEARAWLPFVLTGSLLAQTHVSVVPLVAACGLYSLGWQWRLWASPHRYDLAGRHTVAWFGAASVLMALLWWPPVHEAVSSDGGNLANLWRFFLEPREGQPWVFSLAVWVDRLTALVREPQVFFSAAMTTRMPATDLNALLPWLLAAPVFPGLMLWVSWQAGRSGDRFAGRQAEVILLGSLVALWSITRIPGGVEEYQISWIVGLGMLGLSFAVGTAAESLGASRWLPFRAAVAVAVVGLLTSTAYTTQRFHRNTRVVRDPTSLRVAEVSTQVVARLSEAGHQRVWVSVVSQLLWPEAAGVIVRLRKAGFLVKVGYSNLAVLFGKPLIGTANEGWPVLYLVDATEGTAFSQRMTEVELPGTSGLRVFLDMEPSRR